MSYYQIIKQFFIEDREDEITDWIKAQPLTEQLAITETLKQVINDMWSDDEEDQVEKMIHMAQLDNALESYNDANLDIYNATKAYEKAATERDESFAKMYENIEDIRAHLIYCVTSNTPDAEEMKELALQVIAMEKFHGVYNAENWKGVA